MLILQLQVGFRNYTWFYSALPPTRIIIIIIIGTETTDTWYTHIPKPVYEEGDVTVLWNQAVHTDREVTANRPDIIIKNKNRKSVH